MEGLTMHFWNVYLRGVYLGQVGGYDRAGALRVARVRWGANRPYHVTRDCEGQ